ncbi:hypothetical protein Sjap_022206 [Stephania japonica]|uniref:Probable purine permease n=1 Tax=Stephania japonica TaxID=461633 RepID=A0AAP0ENX1_9MAGN
MSDANSVNIEAGPLNQFSPEHKITTSTSTTPQTQTNNHPTKWPLLLLCCLFTAIGIVGGPLLLRLYYLNGGSRKWLVSCVQTAGFPILIVPVSLLILRTKSKPMYSVLLEPKLLLSSALMGTLLGVINLLYSQGLSYLPVSTATLLQSTQLAFIAVFSRLVVKQKFTAYIVNSVVLMTLGSAMLGIRANGDRPAGVSTGKYWLGFVLTLLSAGLTGIMWPAIELSYRKATRAVTKTTLLQYQLSVAAFATIFSLIGMVVSKDFQAMGREANEFAHGKDVYCTVLVVAAVVFQISFVGSFGLIFFAGSLFTGIFISVLLPITEVASFVAYHEKFNGEKGMSLALCLWAFASYFYGQYNKERMT